MVETYKVEKINATSTTELISQGYTWQRIPGTSKSVLAKVDVEKKTISTPSPQYFTGEVEVTTKEIPGEEKIEVIDTSGKIISKAKVFRESGGGIMGYEGGIVGSEQCVAFPRPMGEEEFKGYFSNLGQTYQPTTTRTQFARITSPLQPLAIEQKHVIVETPFPYQQEVIGPKEYGYSIFKEPAGPSPSLTTQFTMVPWKQTPVMATQAEYPPADVAAMRRNIAYGVGMGFLGGVTGGVVPSMIREYYKPVEETKWTPTVGYMSLRGITTPVPKETTIPGEIRIVPGAPVGMASELATQIVTQQLVFYGASRLGGGESIKQLKWTETKTETTGTIKSGKYYFRGKSSNANFQTVMKGVSIPRLEIGEGMSYTGAGFIGGSATQKEVYWGVSYGWARQAITGSGTSFDTNVFSIIKRLTEYWQPPRGVFYGGRGLISVPKISVTEIYAGSSGGGISVGEPTMTEFGKELIMTKMKYDTASMVISSEGFAAVKGPLTVNVISRLSDVISGGGGGIRTLSSSFTPSLGLATGVMGLGSMGSLGMRPNWAQQMGRITSLGGYYATVTQQRQQEKSVLAILQFTPSLVKPFQKRKLPIGIAQITDQGITTKLKQQPLLTPMTVATPTFITPTQIPTQPKFPFMRLPRLDFGLDFGGPSGMGTVKNIFGKMKTKYVPSLVGLFSGLKISKIPSGLTGMEIRYPLGKISRRRKKKG